MMPAKIAVSIIGQSEIVREGLTCILRERDFDVVEHGAPSDPTGTAEPIGTPEPAHALTIVDASSFGEGLELCRGVRLTSPELRIVLMMDDYCHDEVVQAFSQGLVDGYLLKSLSCESLASALQLVAMGEKLLPSEAVVAFTEMAARATEPPAAADAGASVLSARELEILHCLLDGDANKVISRRLAITDATVKVHVKAILRKLRVKNRTQAAIWAVRRGLAHEWGEAPLIAEMTASAPSHNDLIVTITP